MFTRAHFLHGPVLVVRLLQDMVVAINFPLLSAELGIPTANNINNVFYSFVRL